MKGKALCSTWLLCGALGAGAGIGGCGREMIELDGRKQHEGGGGAGTGGAAVVEAGARDAAGCEAGSAVCEACAADADCRWPRRCDESLGQCVECLAEEDCAWRTIPLIPTIAVACDPQYRICMFACVANDCGPLRCDTARGVCIECENDQVCQFRPGGTCEHGRCSGIGGR